MLVLTILFNIQNLAPRQASPSSPLSTTPPEQHLLDCRYHRPIVRISQNPRLKNWYSRRDFKKLLAILVGEQSAEAIRVEVAVPREPKYPVDIFRHSRLIDYRRSPSPPPTSTGFASGFSSPTFLQHEPSEPFSRVVALE